MELRTIFRIVELIICIVLLVLWYVLSTYATRVMVVCGTIFGFTIITSVLVALEFLEFNQVPVFLIIGAVLSLICGGLTIAYLPEYGDGRLSYFIATGLFIANGVIFLIDFIMELKN